MILNLNLIEMKFEHIVNKSSENKVENFEKIIQKKNKYPKPPINKRKKNNFLKDLIQDLELDKNCFQDLKIDNETDQKLSISNLDSSRLYDYNRDLKSDGFTINEFDFSENKKYRPSADSYENEAEIIKIDHIGNSFESQVDTFTSENTIWPLKDFNYSDKTLDTPNANFDKSPEIEFENNLENLKSSKFEKNKKSVISVFSPKSSEIIEKLENKPKKPFEINLKNINKDPVITFRSKSKNINSKSSYKYFCNLQRKSENEKCVRVVDYKELRNKGFDYSKIKEEKELNKEIKNLANGNISILKDMKCIVKGLKNNYKRSTYIPKRNKSSWERYKTDYNVRRARTTIRSNFKIDF